VVDNGYSGIGPLLGGALFVRQMSTLYVRIGALLVALALMIGWKALYRQREARLAR